MRQCGVVMSTDGDKAKVVLQRHTACGDCQGCKMGNEDMSMEIEAMNSINAKIGDRVEIDMEHQNVLAAAFIAYMLPLFALIGGILIGSILLEKVGLVEYKEVGSGLLGLVLTAITFVAIRLKENSFKSNKKFVPVITGVSQE